MRVILTLLLLLVLSGSVVRAEHGAALALTPIPLDSRDPARRHVGALTYLGGWRMEAGDKGFGGLSALIVEGDRFTALSDTGVRVRWRMAWTRGVARAEALSLTPLRDRDGRIPEAKADRDSESAVLDTADGRMWIGFENGNRVARYPADGVRPEAEAGPAAMRDWPVNGGAEAMVRLKSGAFLVFAEDGDGPGGSTPALLFDRDPADPKARIARFGYRAPAGFKVTDAALLPDGRVVLLNRRFTILSGVAAAVTVIDPRMLSAGGVAEGREIARIEPPLNVDNMEGMAVAHEGERTILWLVSDDNFNPLQRTLLMKFAVDEPAAR